MEKGGSRLQCFRWNNANAMAQSSSPQTFSLPAPISQWPRGQWEYQKASISLVTIVNPVASPYMVLYLLLGKWKLAFLKMLIFVTKISYLL
ncbi:hypothetical protein glysoja_035121 [Glycine soja]|uniref:Uncharacterized protein n=1 Tax=Glycine soja TaxID=3848 RepID=A0A0B2SNC4_GLYSO|nr:hypothetical protein glysoja_035121 [Glycine soja]